MTTADRIKNRRIELGLTQLEVAKRLGLTTKAAVSKVEGQGDNVTLKNVEKFAKALDCSIPYLMGWEEDDGKLSEDDLTNKERHFIETYARLSADQQKLVDNLMSSWLSTQESGSDSQDSNV